ncbi:peptidyl-prolyl cis-trans isomerase FKBP19, chloroplastic isoform X1 [Phoenix dactylifera]|uniref:peptidylprolyl isomerase n=1 Tax=Phoenix dactylifera TaxID=42345 RepID=A0A8B7CE02_PHODC|nr:peptidyl-prolyl cis-trans isomerase FKBP19, chloroplastic isoform X1 [Phoenix dactylifera]
MASISALGFFPNLTNFARGSPRLLPPEGRDFKRGAPQISRISALERDGLFESEAFSLGGETRRKLLLLSTIGFAIGTLQHALDNGKAGASEFADMPALRGKDYGKTKMRYPDYTETQSGLQYKDLRVGDGPTPKMGDMVVVDWDGYTIGYYGRIFEARNKTKGGSFEGDDKGFFKFKLGLGQVIPAFEEAVVGMAPGGIRRIIVPPELGYPDNDFNKLGPRPTTFSGQRALDFVLRNQGLIDKTLLFDIELLKIIPN